MGPRPSVPTRVRSPALTEGRSVVLVVDPQWSTPPELLADLLHQAVLPSSDPLWPGRFPPDVRTVRHREDVRRILHEEPVIAAVLVLPEGDRRAHERTRDLRSVAGPVTLLVVYDGPSDMRADLVGWGADDAVERRELASDLVPRLMTELKRHRRTALERLLSAHLLVDVLAWESGYVLLDPSGRVVESALQSGEPWCGGLTGLRGADLVLPRDVGRFEAVRRLAQQVPSVARTVEVEVVSPGPDRRWLEVTLVNVGSVSPLDGVVATHRDVTGRQRTGRSAVPAPPGVAPAAPVLDLLAEGVAIYGPDGTIRGWNGAATRLLGTPAAEAMGTDVQSLVPHVPPAVPERDGDPDVWSDEVRTVLPDGSEQVLERRFTRLRGEDGVLRETVLVVSSGTESREAAAVSRRFAAILDSSIRGDPVEDDPGHHHHMERGRRARMYGYTAEEVIGRHVRMLVPEDRRAELDHDHRQRADRRDGGAAGDGPPPQGPARRPGSILSVSPLFDEEDERGGGDHGGHAT